MAEHGRHPGDHVHRPHGPADAQPGGGEPLADAVHEHGVARHLREQLGRRHVWDAAEAEHPVDVVVEQEERALAAAGAPLVLLQDRLADAEQLLAREGRAGRVERRVEAEQAGSGEGREQIRPAGEEPVLRPADHRHAHSAHHVHVVVVVPARHRVDHPVAGIAQGAEDAVDDRPGAAGDEHRLDRVAQAQLALVEPCHGLAQLGDAVRRGVVGLPALQRGASGIGEPGRDREVPGIEVPHREVADGPPPGDQGADLRRDAEDLRTDKAGRHGGDPGLGIGSGITDERR